MTQPTLLDQDRPLSELGEALAGLRLRDAQHLLTMRRSLGEHGQLTPLCAFERDGGLQVIDGFKRLVAARDLGWSTVRVRVLEVDVAEATARISELHGGRALTELEEGWIVRALHRDHHRSLGAIASALSRDKSWVWRRLMLVEGLCPDVQANVRLGLIAPRAALVVAALPRGNDQTTASQLVIRRGLTVRQTELLVYEWLDAPSEKRASVFARWSSSGPPARGANGLKKTHRQRGAAESMVVAITTLRRAAGILHGLLGATPLCALEPGSAELLRGSLRELRLVIAALARVIADAAGSDDAKWEVVA